MKTVVVYYSFEGNTKLIADTIADTINADVLSLEPIKEIKTKGFMKYLWGGKQIFMKEEPQIKPLEKDVNDYDFVFIGTPVWACSYAPAVATFFESVKFKDKRVALFCCHQGGKGKVFDKMKEKLASNNIVSQMDFLQPLDNKESSIEKAKQWAQEVVSGKTSI